MLTLLNLAAVLSLQTPPPPPPPHMRTETRVVIMADPDGPGGLDKDGDGQLTREEFAGPMNEAFARMDSDGNGRLSQDELRAGHGPDGDHEMIFRRGPEGAPGERHRQRVMMISEGGPGENGEEHNVFMRRAGPGGEPRVWHDAEGGTRIEIERTGGDDLDADGDGRISEAEFSAPMRDAFARMDADRSGYIEAGERGTGHGSEVFIHRIETRSGDED